MLEEKSERPEEPAPPGETPLPATLTFVMLMGVTFLILWFGIFAILKARW